MTAVKLIRRRRDRIRPMDIVVFLIVLAFAAVFLFPIYIVFMSAFKTQGDILGNPAGFPTTFTLDNFVTLFTRTPLPQAILNTLMVTVIAEALIILVIPMAAYALARKPSKAKNAIYAYFIGGMMIPFQAYMIFLFQEMKWIGLFGTFTGVIIIALSGAVPFGTLLFTSFIKTTIPVEIEEAARIDGANGFMMFWRIVFPLLGPCTASMLVLNGLSIWNDYLMPSLMLMGKPVSMLNPVIYSFVGQFNTRWNLVFTGAVCGIMPALIVFIFLQKYFIKGISSGAVKG